MVPPPLWHSKQGGAKRSDNEQVIAEAARIINSPDVTGRQVSSVCC
jgi:hypothetical protein